MAWLRYGVPVVLVIAGFVILFTASSSIRWDGWAMCIGSGLAVLLLNLLFRYGARGDQDRQAEEDARRYFTQHGRWPED